MEKLTEKAYAKINLTLDMVSKRADGYHEIKSFMQKISLFDQVSVFPIESSIEIECDSPLVPCDGTNICFKAAEKYIESASLSCGVKIEIQKNIPVAAGLAGGSTDGAAVLSLMEKLFKKNVDIEAISKKLGADVHFCLSGKSCVCSGIGDILSEIPFHEKSRYKVVLAKGDMGMSTPFVYSEFDRRNSYKGFNATDFLSDAVKSGEDFTKHLSNDFESIVMEKVPDVSEIKSVLSLCGAENSLMSGSGPSVFGIFKSESDAEKASAMLSEKGYTAHICEFI